MNKYTRLFIDESRKYLDVISHSLQSAGGDEAKPPLEEASRLAHSIKGMALFEEQAAVADLAYAMERGLAEAAAGVGGFLEDLAEGVTALRRMINDVEEEGTVSEGAAGLVAAITGRIEGS